MGGLSGLDPLEVLKTTDPLEQEVISAVIDKRAEILADEQEQQAIRIANAIGKAQRS